jgi:hypothetical protein
MGFHLTSDGMGGYYGSSDSSGGGGSGCIPVIIIFLGMVVVGSVVWGGIKYSRAQDDDQKRYAAIMSNLSIKGSTEQRLIKKERTGTWEDHKGRKHPNYARSYTVKISWDITNMDKKDHELEVCVDGVDYKICNTGWGMTPGKKIVAKAGKHTRGSITYPDAVLEWDNDIPKNKRLSKPYIFYIDSFNWTGYDEAQR